MPDVRSILIVDDSFDITACLQDLFELEGYDVRVAENGIDALRLTGTRTPDMIISDYTMPELDGLALLASVRSNASTRHIPFIMMSALDLTDLFRDWRPNAMIRKPFQFLELRNLVLCHLK